jgi:PAS domain S-box-containing protein
MLVFPEVGAAVVFPPYAVLAAALMLTPPRQWWLYIAAAAAGNFWPHLRHEGITWFVLMAETANVARALVAAGGLYLLLGGAPVLNSLRGMVVFLVFAVVLGPAVGALVGAGAVRLRDPAANFWIAWQAWLLSNVLIGLTLLPLVLVLFTRARSWIGRVSPTRALEAAVLGVGLVGVGLHIFAAPYEAALIPSALYLPLPLLLWAALRFGPAGTIVALSLLTGLTVAGAISGRGPFVALTPAQNLLQLQHFLVAMCVPLLLLSAIVREREQTRQDLQESRANYRAIVEDQTELICRFLSDGTLTFVNDAYARYFDRMPQQLLGRTFWELIPTDAHEGARKHLASINLSRPVATIEHPVVAPSGEIRWQQWTDRGLFDEQGRLVGFQAVGRDITQRKRSEESLGTALRDVSRLKERLEAENTYLQEELSASDRFGDVVCRSEAMRSVLSQVQRVADTDSTVLILGETGVGKEVMARALHRGSARKERPFIRVNCAALPAHLIESELFGHERGAFTGAAARRLGRFEVAHGATLFLDEIGELPPAAQVKLLRVLQEGEFERLGSSETIKVNVRLIAATSRDLIDCVREGVFRPDVYYRLNVFPIRVPALRDRRDDILPLASAFLEQIATQLRRSFEPMSKAVAADLLEHDWPGNVRELHNVIERAAIWSAGSVLRLPPDWNGRLVEADVGVRAAKPTTFTTGSGSGVLHNATASGTDTLQSMHDVERAHILSVLEQTRWRIEGPSGAASVLGIKPSTLRFRMKKLSIYRATDPVHADAR